MQLQQVSRYNGIPLEICYQFELSRDDGERPEMTVVEQDWLQDMSDEFKPVVLGPRQ